MATNQTPLVLGTAQLGQRYGVFGATVDDNVSPSSYLRSAQDMGFAALDTAPAYGDAENLIGDAGVPLPVFTKSNPRLPVIESLERSLVALRRDFVDVFFFHQNVLDFPEFEPSLARLQELQGSALREIGLSIYSREEFEFALSRPEISVIQAPLNVLDRRFAESALEDCDRAGKRLYARSVLLQGLLTASPANLPQTVAHLGSPISAFQAVGQRFSLSPLELALGWVGSLPGLAGLIVGATSSRGLAQIADAARKVLSEEVLSELNALAQPDEDMVDPRRW